MTQQQLSPKHEKQASGSLTVDEELLLTAFFDGESGFFSRMKARSLLRKNPLAKTYLSELESLRDSALPSFFESRAGTPLERDSLEGKPVQLWDRISNRIDQEERAAFFLGERGGISSSTTKEKAPLFGLHEIFWGGAGAAVSFLFVFALWPLSGSQLSNEGATPSSTQVAQQQSVPGENVALVSQVVPRAEGAFSAGSRAAHVPTVTTVSTRRSPIEVDWMKSDGRVRLIQDAAGRTPIIWVKRRSNLPQLGSSRSSINRRGRTSSSNGSLQQRIPTATLVSK